MDFQISDEGSLIGFQAMNDEASAWWNEHVASDDWQWNGNICWVDHREAKALFAVLDDNGFKLGA